MSGIILMIIFVISNMLIIIMNRIMRNGYEKHIEKLEVFLEAKGKIIEKLFEISDEQRNVFEEIIKQIPEVVLEWEGTTHTLKIGEVTIAKYNLSKQSEEQNVYIEFMEKSKQDLVQQVLGVEFENQMELHKYMKKK